MSVVANLFMTLAGEVREQLGFRSRWGEREVMSWTSLTAEK